LFFPCSHMKGIEPNQLTTMFIIGFWCVCWDGSDVRPDSSLR
jgi:hypothetical protein